MGNITVIGAQWGDEGKGKLSDWFAAKADAVARFNGGNNAGHTIKVDGVTYKTALLPAGVIRGKLSVIGNGVVVDPWALLAEMTRLRDQGVQLTPDTLRLSDAACLVLPLHRELDVAREQKRIGTTGRGIGPAYEDKVGRRAVRFADLGDGTVLAERVDALLAHHNPLRASLGLPQLSAQTVLAQIAEIAPQIRPYLDPAPWRRLQQIMARDGCILFEGAQATGLDLDFGTYPFVTASNTMAGQISAGLGLPPKAAGFVLGVVKAYTTRVGAGPFPSEMDGPMGDRIRTIGAEFGVNTGRPRRCGWFDAVAVRQAVAVCGIDGLAITKLDVLDSFEELKICIGYECDGETLEYMPASLAQAARIQPRYETWPGWQSPTAGVRSLEKLPPNAVAFLRRIEALCGAPLKFVGSGPGREDLIAL